MEWFLLPLKKYVEFNGRSRRKEYWMFYLFTVLVSIPLGIIDEVADTTFQYGSGVFSVLFSLFTIIPWISLTVRRLHDVNKSAWYLLLYLLPIIGWIWLFVLTVTEGDQGSNEYGPDPKNPVSELDDIGLTMD